MEFRTQSERKRSPRRSLIVALLFAKCLRRLAEQMCARLQRVAQKVSAVSLTENGRRAMHATKRERESGRQRRIARPDRMVKRFCRKNFPFIKLASCEYRHRLLPSQTDRSERRHSSKKSIFPLESKCNDTVSGVFHRCGCFGIISPLFRGRDERMHFLFADCRDE